MQSDRRSVRRPLCFWSTAAYRCPAHPRAAKGQRPLAAQCVAEAASFQEVQNVVITKGCRDHYVLRLHHGNGLKPKAKSSSMGGLAGL
jgi:hypothetical protein